MLELISGNESYLNRDFWIEWPKEKVSSLGRNEYPPEEYWKDLAVIHPVFEKYLVSIFGRVYSKKTKTCLLPDKDYLEKYGYYRVSLYNNNVAVKYFVHVLVLKAFYRDFDLDEETRHLNNIRSDNRLVNLTIGTHLENWV